MVRPHRLHRPSVDGLWHSLMCWPHVDLRLVSFALVGDDSSCADLPIVLTGTRSPSLTESLAMPSHRSGTKCLLEEYRESRKVL